MGPIIDRFERKVHDLWVNASFLDDDNVRAKWTARLEGVRESLAVVTRLAESSVSDAAITLASIEKKLTKFEKRIVDLRKSQELRAWKSIFDSE